jgi:hypothetical protein
MGHHRFLPMDHKWRRNKVSFNNKTEYREAPQPLTGEQVLQHYDSFDQVKFSPESKKGSSATKTRDGTIGGRRVFSSSFCIGKICLLGTTWM